MEKYESATLASGCFWCIDAVLSKVKGIHKIVSGYTGGFIKNPAYREVCQDITGHAEAVEIKFDPAVISYEDILLIFFTTHDPTSLNQQGYDKGTQYRSAIFYHNEMQKETAEKVIQELNSTTYNHKIVTELLPAAEFYEAEEVHQNFYNRNKDFPYCQVVINPKLGKLRRHFADKLKENNREDKE